MSLNQLEKDSIVTQARSVVAPPSGIHNDLNSKIYGNARLRLETVLADLVFSTAAFLWKKKPRANSSFREFEAIVAGIKDVSLLKADACGAIDLLVDSAYDPQAESSALAERVSDTELTRRRAIIASMKRHLPVLKLTGRSLVTTFATELEQVLEGRIASA